MRCPWVLMIMLGAGTAHADDPKFVFGKKDDVKDVKEVDWHAAAEAGLVLTTGNSETTTGSGGIRVSRKTGANLLALEASGAYAKSGIRVLDDQNGNGMIDGPAEIATVETVTAETIASKLRYDRFLTELNSLYVAALASRDVPAGKEYAFGGQLGYSRSLQNTQTSITVAELGYDFSREEPTTGNGMSIHSGRVFIGHKSTLAEGTQLDASAELLTNFNRETLPTGKDGGPLKDTRVNVKLGVSAKLGPNLAFQTAIEAHYDNRPGPMVVKNLAMGYVPEASSLDTLMKVSLIYTFVGTTK